MDWFSEKFMEDCVAEAPEAFLGRPLRLRSQQPRLGGFIPDLIFADQSGTSVIVEVQKSALDRYHLYKCVEYRDLLASEEGGRQPVVALVCETLPARYQRIAETHNVEIHLFSREQIVERAIASCPHSLKSHLLKPQAGNSDEHIVSPPEKLRRYKWNEYDTLSNVYGFVLRELTRCGLWAKLQGLDNGSDYLWTAQSVLDTRDSYSDLLNPVGWRIDNLVAKPTSWVPPDLQSLTRIRKPKATFDVFETSKGNLSVRWFPKGATQWNFSATHDWIAAPSTEPYAYQRPANEILFIKNIRHLSTDPDHYVHFEDGDERAALNTMLLALVWAIIRHVRQTISVTVELDVLSEFQLTTGGPTKADSLTPRYDIMGWRLIGTGDLRIEDAERRISLFGSQNSVSVETVLQVLETELGRSSPPKGDRATYLAKALRANGHKITAVPIRQLLSDFELVRYPAYLPFKISGD